MIHRRRWSPVTAIVKRDVASQVVTNGRFPLKRNPVPLLCNLSLFGQRKAFLVEAGIGLSFRSRVDVTSQVGQDTWKAEAD